MPATWSIKVDAAAASEATHLCRFSMTDVAAMHRWACMAFDGGFKLEFDVHPDTGEKTYVAAWAEGDEFVSVAHVAACTVCGADCQCSDEVATSTERTILHRGTHVEVIDRMGRPMGAFATLRDALESFYQTL